MYVCRFFGQLKELVTEKYKDSTAARSKAESDNAQRRRAQQEIQKKTGKAAAGCSKLKNISRERTELENSDITMMGIMLDELDIDRSACTPDVDLSELFS